MNWTIFEIFISGEICIRLENMLVFDLIIEMGNFLIKFDDDADKYWRWVFWWLMIDDDHHNGETDIGGDDDDDDDNRGE